jgi:subfamily B ATP-binding cassette protein MsbA
MKTCWRAIRYFSRDWKLIAALVVCIGISFTVDMMMPWSWALFLDLIVQPSDRPRTDWIHATANAWLPASTLGKIWALALFGLAATIALHTTWFIGRVMLNKRIRYNGLARVRLALYAKLQHLALDFHRARPQGDTIYRLCADTQGFFNILDTIIGAAVSCITLIVVVAVILAVSVKMTLLALCIVPPLVITNICFARAIKKRALLAKQADSDFTTAVQRSMGAIGLIQLFCRHAADLLRFKDAVDKSNDANWRLNWFEESLYPMITQLILAIEVMLIMGVGGMLAYHDQVVVKAADGFTFGALVAFMSYIARLNEPLSRITGIKAALQTNLAAADRVFSVLDTPITVADHPQAAPLPLRSRTLTLEDVSFAYPASERPPIVAAAADATEHLAVSTRVLSNVDATITPGQFVAFVGSSGAGKTTLFSLLPRFYDPTSGVIRLDGHDVRGIMLSDLRKHIAMVQQDCPLFPGTVAENIAFARPDADRADIMAAARAAGAHDFIAHLDHGYDTMIAESAANLSGGQRQRLALARAILADAPILLLDEPTSAQDPHHAAAIIDTLNDLRGTRTILMVTHDLSLAEEADAIFVMEQGSITETGTHAQLLAKGGTYCALRAAGEDTPPSLHIAS